MRMRLRVQHGAGGALRLIPKHKPEIVLMDIQLPDIFRDRMHGEVETVLMPTLQIIMVTRV